MKHAGPTALATLEPLLAQIRQRPGLKESRPGVFYRKSKAFLHFHEDANGLFADIRGPEDADFFRLPVSSAQDREALIARIDQSLC